MKPTKPFLLFSSLLILVVIFFNIDRSKADSIAFKQGPSMKGVCWVAGDSIAEHNIQQAADIGSNWISQTPFGWMDGHQSTEVRGNFDKAWWGETDLGIRHTAELAKKQGIKTMLKPHIWMHSKEGKWRSDINMNSEKEWEQWFESYGAWILHYAELAEESHIESLCIGTELHSTTVGQPAHWRKLIGEIRKVYSGQLTYAANWYKEYEEIEFWDELDYIGIQAYFPLANSKSPNKEELLKSWESHKVRLEKLSNQFKKKIVFTEIGYKNTADAAIEPWTWPQKLDRDTEISEEVQEICYNALFESFWHEPWFDGLFIWKWFHTTHRHNNYETYFAERRKRYEERAKRRGRDVLPHIYFSPQHGKGKALEILSAWYNDKIPN